MNAGNLAKTAEDATPLRACGAGMTLGAMAIHANWNSNALLLWGGVVGAPNGPSVVRLRDYVGEIASDAPCLAR